MWFIRGGRRCRPFPPQTRVPVDAIEIGDAVASIRHTIYQVDRCSRRDAIEVRGEPRCVRDRPEPPVPRRVPVSLLTSYQPTHPFEMSGPSDGDLRTIMEASRW